MARRRRRRGKNTNTTYGLGPTPKGGTGVAVNPTLGIPNQGLGNLPSGPSKLGPGGLPGQVTGPPVDPQLEAQKAQSRLALSLGGTWDAYQTGQIKADYGFDADGGVDPNNPYSRASLLQRTYENSRRGTTNSYAAAGQLYAGSLVNAQNSNDRNYDIGIDQLKKQEGSQLDSILKGALDRYSTYGLGDDQAGLDALLRALGGR